MFPLKWLTKGHLLNAPCAYPGFKPQSLKPVLHLISVGLPKLKVKYVLKYFDQDFNHLTAKECSAVNLNEKDFFFLFKKMFF